MRADIDRIKALCDAPVLLLYLQEVLAGLDAGLLSIAENQEGAQPAEGSDCAEEELLPKGHWRPGWIRGGCGTFVEADGDTTVPEGIHHLLQDVVQAALVINIESGADVISAVNAVAAGHHIDRDDQLALCESILKNPAWVILTEIYLDSVIEVSQQCVDALSGGSPGFKR